MEERRLAVSEECVEPELVSPGGQGPRASGPRPGPVPPPQPPGLLARLKALIAAGLALLGFALLVSGALLTSTVIGAIIGIPLLLLGALVFYLLFKFLSLGASPTVTFRRF
ncbi:MAG TPA: hypothetical protein DCW72_06260 [Elusimicrobia bacterium]|nr:MAG: hypothetical protein A2X29_07945 [Elusimicrobia bacterium GWA2_64_40]OGR66344.1 MAG: hypothetical protein A2X30_10495 [Elusimicrobia bacterium GWB2_63_16]HAN03742.1 hypothetical protein [Elusimicrobiota bacterium]HAU89827.1 hypothetical protein [Elusimicrobiota bacterium]